MLDLLGSFFFVVVLLLLFCCCLFCCLLVFLLVLFFGVVFCVGFFKGLLPINDITVNRIFKQCVESIVK